MFIEQARTALLHGMAHGEPADVLICDLCLALERQVPGTVVGVTMLDRPGKVFEHALFPSLAKDYAEGIRGCVVADRPGSCALAVLEGKAVRSADVAADQRFIDAWRFLSLKHGLQALVSIPARISDDPILGTLVVAYPPAAPPTDFEQHLLVQVAELTAQLLAYRRQQESQRLLLGELEHRMRNLFSTMGAMAHLTLKAHPEPGAFRAAYDGRLLAMARAHSLALSEREIDLQKLLADTLAPYEQERRIVLGGPALTLAKDAAMAFALATHELTTNAVKYGGLSRVGGEVEVKWTVLDGWFSLAWRERGGPEVLQAPSRQGFGSKTLRNSLRSAFDAVVTLEYRPEGLCCHVSAPLTERLGEVRVQEQPLLHLLRV